MQQPRGYSSKGNSNQVCKLHKAIYGLKQVSRAWYEKLKTTLVMLGFNATKSDNSFYIRKQRGNSIYILVYVDDILITGDNHQEIETVVGCLDKQFAIKDLGETNYFLGIHIQRNADSSINVSQKQYI